MLGAIAGDIIGSVYESRWMKSTDFPLFSRGSTFTDDTVLTVAVADCVLHDKDYTETLKEYGRRYPDAGYGVMFYHWLNSPESVPYNSFGNGSAMRVSPEGFAFPSLDEVLYLTSRPLPLWGKFPSPILLWIASSYLRRRSILENR